MKTWVSNKIYDWEILSSNYRIYRHDKGSYDRVVLIAVSDHTPSRRLATTSGLEAVLVQLDLPPSLLVGCVYISPCLLWHLLHEYI